MLIENSLDSLICLLAVVIRTGMDEISAVLLAHLAIFGEFLEPDFENVNKLFIYYSIYVEEFLLFYIFNWSFLACNGLIVFESELSNSFRVITI